MRAARIAKIYCARAARTVCETSIQVHGGIGNTWECLAHVYLRRVLTSTELWPVTPGGDRPWIFVIHRGSRVPRHGCASGLDCSAKEFPTSGDEYWSRAGEWHQALYAAGFFGLSWPDGIRRAGSAAGLRRHPRRGTGAGRRTGAAEPGLPGRRPGPARQRGTAATVPARNDQRHRAVVPGLLRTRCRIGPRIADHHRHPRRRQLRHSRPQDLDQLLRRRRLVPAAGPHRQGCAAPPRHLGVHRLHAPAGDRAAATDDDQRCDKGIRPGRLRRSDRCPRARWSVRPGRAGRWR